MSHIVTIETQVRDPAAVEAACRRLGLGPPQQQAQHRLYLTEATGWAVTLPGWRHPLVCNTATGALAYDNFNGHWGKQAELDKFLQAYAVETAKLQARRKGHSISEQPLADGSIKLTVQVGGAA